MKGQDKRVWVGLAFLFICGLWLFRDALISTFTRDMSPIVVSSTQVKTSSQDGGSNVRNRTPFRFKIVVITWRRPASLARLLESLSEADYLGEMIQLTIFVEAGADKETMRLVESFDWEYGPKEILVRSFQAGLIANILESWWPATDDEIVAMFEDDIQVSPLFFRWIVHLINHYKITPSSLRHEHRDLLGISLYSPRIAEGQLGRPKMNYKLVSRFV
jgi:hypothetical protein